MEETIEAHPTGSRRPVKKRKPTKRIDSRPATSSVAAPAVSAPLESIVRQNVLEIVARHFPWPISFLAVLAAWDIYVSGSEALECWMRGHGSTRNSDLDLYVPCRRAAVHDLCRLFNHAQVQWNNYIVRKVQELDTSGRIMVPCAMIMSLATLLADPPTSREDWSTERLRQYLLARISQSESKGSNMVQPFLSQFCAQVEIFRKAKVDSETHQSSWQYRNLQDEASSQIWVFDATGASPSGFVQSVGSSVSNLVLCLFEILDDCSRDEKGRLEKTKLKELLDHNITYGNPETTVIGAVEDYKDGKLKITRVETQYKINMRALKNSWLETGLTDQMLHEYIVYTMVNDELYAYRSGIYLVVSEALRLTSEEESEQDYQDDFRILRGTLQGGKKIQIIVDAANRRHPLYTILQFYATHVMVFLGGMLCAHMYYSTAKELRSLKLDFSEDRRQELAEWAIEYKYRPRGWDFEDMNRKEVRSRAICDQETKMVDFEPLYAAALQKVHAGEQLPNDIRDFFTDKRNALKSLTWREEYGRIPKESIGSVYGMGGSTKTAGSWQEQSDHRGRKEDRGTMFLEWVHRCLSDHDQVISEKSWTGQHVVDTELDLFFGGIRSI